MTRAARTASAGTFDVIVVGVGAMGSAVCAQLAARGQRVLGLENTRPTSRCSGGPEDGWVFGGSLSSCIEHDLRHEVLTAAEVAHRFPGHRPAPDALAVWQPDGGFLRPERVVVAQVHRALARGARIHAREPMLTWSTDSGGVTVTTPRGRYRAERLVLATGAWIGEHTPVLRSLSVPERQVLGWFQPHEPALFTPGHFPVFNSENEHGRWYGFPVYGIPGVKIGRYRHLGESGRPDLLRREPDARDEALLRGELERSFPAAAGPVMSMRTCLFTNTPDGHFLIDHAPGEPRVLLASPCSGHGFKFASVLGEALADLVVDGSTRHDLSFVTLDRFATPGSP